MDKPLYQRRPLGTLAFTVLLSVCCGSAKPASAQSALSENNGQNSVHGIVVNSLTHEPIGRALVYSPDNRFATMTDSEGRFEFTFAQTETDKNREDEGSPNISGSRVTANCVDSSCTSVRSSTSSYSFRRNGPDQLMARKPGFLNDPGGIGIQNLQLDTSRDITIPLTPEALVVGRVFFPPPKLPTPSNLNSIDARSRKVAGVGFPQAQLRPSQTVSFALPNSPPAFTSC